MKCGQNSHNSQYYSNSENVHNQYSLISYIGRGSFGSAYLVKDLRTDKIYCLKNILKNPRQTMESIHRESEMMKILDCDFIVRYVECFEGNNYINIIMEYCDGGNLQTLIDYHQVNNFKFFEDEICNIFIQLCLGIAYMHKNNMIHLDLKPANILYTKDFNIKIADLGISRQLTHPDELLNLRVGTHKYMSPETTKNENYDKRADVFSIGIILYELLTLKYPFYYTPGNKKELYNQIQNIDPPIIKENYSKQLIEIVPKLMEKDYKSRPNLIDVLISDFFIEKAKKFDLYKYYPKCLKLELTNEISLDDELAIIKKYLLEDLKIPLKYFDFRYNNRDGGWAGDFETRANFPYFPPHGWFGIGLNITTLYPNVKDNLWLEWRDQKGVWASAYHGIRIGGTSLKIGDKIKGIILNGLKEGPTQFCNGHPDLMHPGKKVGIGVYHYNDIQEMVYNAGITPDEKGFLFAFQCRVNPESIMQSKNRPTYWVVKGSKEHTRPYRLLFRRIKM